MNTINQGLEGLNVDARQRTMMIVWFALLMSVSMMFFLTLVIQRPAADGSDNTLLWVFAAASIFPFLLSFVIKRKLLAQAVTEQKPALVRSAMIVAVALCESVSLFGMIVYFTTTTPYYYVFFIISVIGILLHMPRRDQLLAASYRTQG